MENEFDKLTLIVQASFTGVIGYGSVFKCHVLKNTEGNFDEQDITVTILTGDTSNLAFISSHAGKAVFEMGCKKLNENEPYALMPISGFVDSHKTSWEIMYLREH